MATKPPSPPSTTLSAHNPRTQNHSSGKILGTTQFGVKGGLITVAVHFSPDAETKAKGNDEEAAPGKDEKKTPPALEKIETLEQPQPPKPKGLAELLAPTTTWKFPSGSSLPGIDEGSKADGKRAGGGEGGEDEEPPESGGGRRSEPRPQSVQNTKERLEELHRRPSKPGMDGHAGNEKEATHRRLRKEDRPRVERVAVDRSSQRSQDALPPNESERTSRPRHRRRKRYEIGDEKGAVCSRDVVGEILRDRISILRRLKYVIGKEDR